MRYPQYPKWVMGVIQGGEAPPCFAQCQAAFKPFAFQPVESRQRKLLTRLLRKPMSTEAMTSYIAEANTDKQPIEA
jgi:hypothetical protein